MSYRQEKETGDIVMSGFEDGIASSPHRGIANMQGVNIATETGEAMCSFNRVKQSQVGTTGTLTQVNTNTVSVSGITLKVGQVITITNAGTTGLSGNYYYLSTGKLYAGSLPPNAPDSATAVTGIVAGSATFSITYPLGQPIQSATEPYYRDLTQSIYYRYYILDNLGQVWCHDTYTLQNWDTPVWFFVGTGASASTSGLAVYNGWLTISVGTTHTYWKLTSLLGTAWYDSTSTSIQPINFFSNANHVMLSGNQGKLYGTDGRYVTSLFANTSLTTGVANIQSYAKYSATALGAELITNGSFTGSAAGWTLNSGWTYAANSVSHSSDSTDSLFQAIPTLTNHVVYKLVFTVSNWSVGTVTAGLNTSMGDPVGANGTYTQYITSNITSPTSGIAFTTTNTARLTIDNVSLKAVGAGSVSAIIGGSAPSTGDTYGDDIPRIPALFLTDGTLPSAISASDVRYYIEWISESQFNVYTSLTGNTGIDFATGAAGNQYFSTFSPTNSATYIYTAQRVNLPFTETATALAELGNTVIIGGISNILYPWDQVSALPSDLIPLPESNTRKIITVNNVVYIFAGNKGNIYISNGSSTALALKIPDYCAGIPGTPSTYIEPYFSWGDAMYCRGRVYCSILDQTAAKTGNCGGIWSFVPTQNFFIGQDTGQALRLDNQNSYGTYNGVATVLLPSRDQIAVSPQYWSGWYSSISAPTYGIDFTDTIPEETTTIELDLLPTGTTLDKKTFSQLEYKVASPLVSGDSISLYYRLNATGSFTSCGSAIVENATNLSGYFPINFQKTQWVQIKVVLTPLASASSSFIRLKEIRLR